MQSRPISMVRAELFSKPDGMSQGCTLSMHKPGVSSGAAPASSAGASPCWPPS